jgi:hypothetical protein
MALSGRFNAEFGLFIEKLFQTQKCLKSITMSLIYHSQALRSFEGSFGIILAFLALQLKLRFLCSHLDSNFSSNLGSCKNLFDLVGCFVFIGLTQQNSTVV